MAGNATKTAIDKATAEHLEIAQTLAARFAEHSTRALDSAAAGQEGADRVALRAGMLAARMLDLAQKLRAAGVESPPAREAAADGSR